MLRCTFTKCFYSCVNWRAMNSENLVRTACDSSRLWLMTPYEFRDVCCLQSQDKKKKVLPSLRVWLSLHLRKAGFFFFVSQLENTVQLLNVQLVINKLTRFRYFYPFSCLGGHFALSGVYVHSECVFKPCVCMCVRVLSCTLAWLEALPSAPLLLSLSVV